MKKLGAIIAVCFALLTVISCSRHNVATTKEKIPFIAGSWLEDGDTGKPIFIVQKEVDLIFLKGKQTSTGYFKNSYRIVLKEWNTTAILSEDANTISWKDVKWNKTTFRNSDISGDWYENSDSKKKISITQDNNVLVLDNGTSKVDAYFYTTNGIYSPTWNRYATYNPGTKTLTWGNTSWVRTAIK